MTTTVGVLECISKTSWTHQNFEAINIFYSVLNGFMVYADDKVLCSVSNNRVTLVIQSV